MEAAYIISFSLHNFNETAGCGTDLVHFGMFFFFAFHHSRRHWHTHICHFHAEQWSLLIQRFYLYLKKEAVSRHLNDLLSLSYCSLVQNEYKVRMIRSHLVLSNGQQSADVEFPTLAESGFDPQWSWIHQNSRCLCQCSSTAQYRAFSREECYCVPEQEKDFSSPLMSQELLPYGLFQWPVNGCRW